MLSAQLRRAVVIVSFLLIALVALRPFIGDATRAYPLAVVALLAALAVHGLYGTRYR
jgi:hypothetical protein